MTQDEVANLPISHISFILRLWEAPERVGYAVGKAEGAVAGALSTQGIIRPMGKIGRRGRWQIISKALTRENIILMKEIYSSYQKSEEQNLKEIVLDLAKRVEKLEEQNATDL